MCSFLVNMNVWYVNSDKAKNVQIWAIHGILIVEISNFVINFLNFLTIGSS